MSNTFGQWEFRTHVIGKVRHEQLLVHRGIIQFSLLPALVAGHEERVTTLGIVQLIVEVWELSNLKGITVRKRSFRTTKSSLYFLFVYLIIGSVSSLPSIVVYGTPSTRSIMCTNPLVWATSACSTVALTPPPSTVTTVSDPSPLTLKYRNVRLFTVGTWAIYLSYKGERLSKQIS